MVRDYGLSECLGHAPGRPNDPAHVRWRKEGVPLPGLEFRITEPGTNQPMPLGEVEEDRTRHYLPLDRVRVSRSRWYPS